MKCAKFVILLHDSLHAIAMRQLLGNMPAASCAIISSAADILDADYIITDSTVAIAINRADSISFLVFVVVFILFPLFL